MSRSNRVKTATADRWRYVLPCFSMSVALRSHLYVVYVSCWPHLHCDYTAAQVPFVFYPRLSKNGGCVFSVFIVGCCFCETPFIVDSLVSVQCGISQRGFGFLFVSSNDCGICVQNRAFSPRPAEIGWIHDTAVNIYI